VRHAYVETSAGRRSTLYRPGEGWTGRARRRPGIVTRSVIVVASVLVCILLLVVMTNAPQP